MNPVDLFKTACEAAGLVLGEIISDGKINRCPTVGKERGQDGAYLFHADSPASGWYMNYRTGQADTWTAENGQPLTPAEREALAARIEADKAAREAETAKRRGEARARANEILVKAKACQQDHPYLKVKNIKLVPGVKLSGQSLVVPVLGPDGKPMSLQSIGVDGKKRFLPGGQVHGGYFAIRGKDIAGKLFVCEGFATGASIHESTGATVIVAFDCNNLVAVAAMARRLYPEREIIVCGDDDRETEGNPGITKATKAAREAAALLALPVFADPEGKSDFNDLATAEGLEAVKRCLDAARAPEAIQAEAQAATAQPGLALVRASDVKPEPVNWIWPGHLSRGVVHVFDGVPGVGKTLLTGFIAGRLTTGSPWPDRTKSEIGNVIMVNLEDDLNRTLRPRLEAAGADLDRVFFFDDTEDGFVIPGDLDRLEKTIVQHEAKLVVIDPLMAVLEGRVNSYRDQDVRRVLAALKALCGRTGCAVVLVRHLTKASGAPAIHRGGGSIGIIGAARLGLLMAADPGDDTRRILATVKNNLGPFNPKKSTSWTIAPGPRLEFVGSTDITADDLLLEQDEKRGRGRPEKKSGAAEWAAETLSDGPMPSTMFYKRAETAGFNERTIRRAGVVEAVKIAGTWQVKLAQENQDGQKSIYKEFCPPCLKTDGKPLNTNDFQDGQKPFVQDEQAILSTLNDDDCPDEVEL